MTLRTTLLAAVVVLALAAPVAHAQAGGDYEMTRSTHSGGGLIPVTAGDYALGGSIGQADAGLLVGGDFKLVGGFWGAATSATTDANHNPDPIPHVFASRLASANPFRESMSLAFELPTPRRVAVVVFGVDGRVVRRLPEVARNAGRHQVSWDGRDEAGRRIAPGVYFLSLKAGEFSATHRVVRLD